VSDPTYWGPAVGAKDVCGFGFAACPCADIAVFRRQAKNNARKTVGIVLLWVSII
jgi:hypothetical protein